MKEYDELKSAAILPFPRRKLPAKRGRPRSERLETDSGTPELVMKRLLGETTETLDLCLARQLITPEQHWCGVHLRWLYTLRYGAPGVRAVDPTHIGGKDLKIDDPDWRTAREIEYQEAITKLSSTGYAVLLKNICIHNERPAFLNKQPLKTKKPGYAASALITNLCDGLDILVKLWKKPKRK